MAGFRRIVDLQPLFRNACVRLHSTVTDYLHDRRKSEGLSAKIFLRSFCPAKAKFSIVTRRGLKPERFDWCETFPTRRTESEERLPLLRRSQEWVESMYGLTNKPHQDMWYRCVEKGHRPSSKSAKFFPLQISPWAQMRMEISGYLSTKL